MMEKFNGIKLKNAIKDVLFFVKERDYSLVNLVTTVE